MVIEFQIVKIYVHQLQKHIMVSRILTDAQKFEQNSCVKILVSQPLMGIEPMTEIISFVEMGKLIPEKLVKAALLIFEFVRLNVEMKKLIPEKLVKPVLVMSEPVYLAVEMEPKKPGKLVKTVLWM